jgi:hypothetical protein
MGKMCSESEVLLQPGHKWNNIVFYNHTGLKTYPHYMCVPSPEPLNLEFYCQADSLHGLVMPPLYSSFLYVKGSCSAAAGWGAGTC